MIYLCDCGIYHRILYFLKQKIALQKLNGTYQFVCDKGIGTRFDTKCELFSYTYDTVYIAKNTKIVYVLEMYHVIVNQCQKKILQVNTRETTVLYLILFNQIIYFSLVFTNFTQINPTKTKGKVRRKWIVCVIPEYWGS